MIILKTATENCLQRKLVAGTDDMVQLVCFCNLTEEILDLVKAKYFLTAV